ncbi:HEAT repeat domain-containing protein [Methylotenera sp.]|uniref:HEAT repeat domain-containing protein n=1 Tax=Methylotenera sp. TaxID=2051956 RepID=UPI00248868D6|nr:HEAT repeat domain-containing protein [Methylotenera sp.]MDI1362679.1 HEAT repeat domain-containing protein [Methylotenera sp.]
MVPAICEAVKHKDMKRRRYAIGALGYINERAAMPTLEAILSDESEIDYFRGDALQSIYQIDSKRGLSYAAQYQSQPNTLGQYAKAVIKREPWLLLPSKE